MNQVIIIANNTFGKMMSGGDRIWIELTKNLTKTLNIVLFTSEEGLLLLKKSQKKEANISIIKTDKEFEYNNLYSILGLIKMQIRRTYKGIKYISANIDIIKNSDFIYSSSDFYPDFLPAFFAKIINKKIKWVAGFYLFAPFPLFRNTPYKGIHRVKGLLYWFMQLPSYFIVKYFADYVFVTSEPDIKRFHFKKKNKSRILAIKGGIDISESEKYLKFNDNIIPLDKRKYDACFVGRFHAQKGCLELIDIWSNVNNKKKLKLVLIGDGELRHEIENKVAKLSLQNQIDILGFLDGKDKYEIFKQSKLMIHPAIYDSGGMAMAEGMAFGLPGMSFDLEALKSYYPKGVIKIPCFDIDAFANAIISLLENEKLYKEFSKEAYKYAKTWDWRERANYIYKQVFEK
ncbi:MAG: glycosyltransferase [Candidatus Acididesulfobacter guangdongensis]|uniref:Glycosyltransferase n=1 Tax=Acididesulfobacter guangdongensis TaxID=2597225 RepID=A0A519BHW3_ACIG2|nr:MAG: glycosyltransferase [Candidatus Acididesulfobacter guangdongensis]